MALSLLRQAEATEDDAAALQRFLDYVPQRDAEIAPNVQLLIEIAAALRDVDLHLSEEFASTADVPGRLYGDVNLVLRSMSHTNRTLDQALFQQTRLTAHTGRPSYHLLWHNSDDRFRREGGYALYHRLEIYNTFLGTILDGIRRHVQSIALMVYSALTAPERLRPNSGLMDSMRLRLSQLLRWQDPASGRVDAPHMIGPGELHVACYYHRDSANVPGPLNPPRAPQMSPPMHPFPPLPLGALTSPLYDASAPPPVPEVNSSPPFSGVSDDYTWSSWSSSSHDGNGYQTHWAMRIFNTASTMTPFRDPGAP